MIPCAILLHCHDLDDVQALVTATQFLDEHQIRRGRIGHIYTTGVRYRREEHETLPGVERVQTAEEAGAMGDGDCDDLAPWLAASRRVLEGVNARAKAVESPGIGYHVVVEYPDGRIEDPSARLGMLDGTIAGQKADRKARLRRLSGQLLSRATDLAKQAAAANPYTAAGRALIAQARNHLARAKGAAAAADELEANGDEGDDEGDDEGAAVSGRRGKARRHARHAKRHGGSGGGGEGGGASGAPGDGSGAPDEDDGYDEPSAPSQAPRRPQDGPPSVSIEVALRAVDDEEG